MMWAIPTGTSTALKKNQVKSPSIWSRIPELGSDPSNGLGWETGRDKWYQSLGLAFLDKSQIKDVPT